jgi:hypothetical protein
MYTKDRVEIILKISEVIEMLNEAVDKAGGGGYSIKDLNKMSALELICTMATNKIGFFYDK